MKNLPKVLLTFLFVFFSLIPFIPKDSPKAGSIQNPLNGKREEPSGNTTHPSSLQGMITQDLQVQMEKSTPKEWIPITILMRDQIDPVAVERLVTGKSREDRRKIVIQELKRFTAENQREILKFLREKEEAGEVKDLQSFWISNMISGKMAKGMIEAVARMKGIQTIDKERYLRVIDAVESVEENPKIASIEWNITKIDAPCAWSQGFTGQGIIVGNIDTGVNYNHVDLQDHFWRNDAEFFGTPGVDDDLNGYVDDIYGYDFANNDGDPIDDHGHGTHTAGTVAGDGTAGDSVGVAPDAQIMALKVCTSGGGCSGIAILNGVQYALENGAHVLTISLGGGAGSVSASSRNTYNNALLVGVLSSIAAGNAGSGTNTITSPGSVPPPWLHPDQTLLGGLSGVITVGATNSGDFIAGFSSQGPVTWENVDPWYDYPWPADMGLIDPDVSAPGVCVTSLRHSTNNGYVPCWSGTSMATPHVAGLIALMLSKNPGLSPAELDSIIEMTSVDLGTPGKDNDYGAGRIDCCAAINGVQPPNSPLLKLTNYILIDSTGNGDGRPDPNETIEIVVTLENHPLFLDATNVQAILSSPDTTLTMVDSVATFPDIPADSTGDNSGDPFTFTVNPGIIPHWATLVVEFTADPNSFSGIDSFIIRVGRPEILVVDDDEGSSYENFYTSPLDSLQVLYDLWNITLSGIPGTELARYSCVIWFTGDDATTTLTPQDELDLAAFLDGGGNLFISGQNIGEDIGSNPFYANYLKATFLLGNANDNVLSGVPGDEIGDGIDLVIQGGNGAGNATSEDRISPLSGADSLFTYTNALGTAALKYDSGIFRVVYFAFPFEAIHGVGPFASRDTVMERVLDWFCSAGVGVEETDNAESTMQNAKLLQNLPNPFRLKTIIHYQIPTTSHISLMIYDLSGRLVETLVNEQQESGVYGIQWEGKDQSSGIYFYRLSTDNATLTRKMVFLR